MRGVGRVVVGDVTNASGNESLLRQRGVTVDVLESAKGIAQYAAYREQYPELDLEDGRGLAVPAPAAASPAAASVASSPATSPSAAGGASRGRFLRGFSADAFEQSVRLCAIA